MTANSLKTLPPEFINRIEERFFFDLPSQEVRMDILKIHLLHETHLTAEDIATFPLLELAKASDNLVPREMWQAVKTALRRSFFAEKPKLDADILLDELKTRPRILRTMDAELKEVLDWVGWDPETQEGVRARFASSKQSNTTLAILKGGRK
jgi:SpoVK/Ycf46/Vps4 family AAA+-type ATPase